MLNRISDIMQELSKINYYNINNNKYFYINCEDNLRELYLKNSGEVINEYRKTNLLNHPSSKDIPILMYNLFKWINYAKDKTHPLLIAGVIYSSLIFISPYEKNNIAIANMWLKNILTNFNDLFFNVSIEYYFEKHKNNYDALINNTTDTNLFIEFLLDIIYEIIKDKQKNCFANENISKLLNIMELNRPMTAYEIMSQLNIKSKETLRNSYLNDAIKEKLVFLTIPNKPTSRNQKYYRII